MNKIIYEIPTIQSQISLFKYFFNLGDKFKNNIYNEYPQLENKDLDSFVKDLYEEEKDNLEDIKLLSQREWNKIEDNILEEFSKILQKDWDIDNVVGGISLVPFSTRDIEYKRIDIYYKKDITSILKTTTHEIFHFIYFNKWKEIFLNTSIKDMDYPEPVWALSEIALPIMLNNSKVIDILGVKFNRYAMFKDDDIYEYLDNLYKENSLEDFFKKSYVYIKKHHEKYE